MCAESADQPSQGPGGSKRAESDRTGAPAVAPGLHLVATPIGNVGDLGDRARAVLAAADIVACEDTRVTGRLLARLGISTPLAAYHDHNAARARPKLLARLRAGETVALVSDAGTPLVSDPGYRLVRACIDEDLPLTAEPGPSAALTALVLSGLPTDRFLFAGFPPPRAAARRRTLAEVAAVPATLIFYDSARRLADCLADMADILGDRNAAVARELTKKFEEIRRGSLAVLAAAYAVEGPPKGEVTIVVGPPAAPGPIAGDDLDRRLRDALDGASLRDAAAAVAAATGLPRRRVYARALEIAGEMGSGDEAGEDGADG